MLHNSKTCSWLKLEETCWVVFSPDPGVRCKSVDWNLRVSPYLTENSALLSRLQAGDGIEPCPNSFSGDWEIYLDGPIIMLRSKAVIEIRIALTLDGFIYFCPKGSMNVDQNKQSCTDFNQGKLLLNQAISKIKSEELKARVSSLQVNCVDKSPADRRCEKIAALNLRLTYFFCLQNHCQHCSFSLEPFVSKIIVCARHPISHAL